jgi:hypothetical protein
MGLEALNHIHPCHATAQGLGETRVVDFYALLACAQVWVGAGGEGGGRPGPAVCSVRFLVVCVCVWGLLCVQCAPPFPTRLLAVTDPAIFVHCDEPRSPQFWSTVVFRRWSRRLV